LTQLYFADSLNNMRQPIDVQWLISREADKPRILQVYRQGLEYSLLSADNRQCCYFVWCKDFLQDAIQGYLYDTRKETYGFEYDPSLHPPIDLRRARILITNSRDSEFDKKIPPCLDFLNQIEVRLKLRKTTCTRCVPTPRKYQKCGVWLFEGSRLWQIAPPMLSLYTLFIRVGFAHKVGTPWNFTVNHVRTGLLEPYQRGRYTSDKTQLEEAQDGIRKIMRFGPRRLFHRDIFENYPEDMDIDTMHNEMGIVSFSNETTKLYIPYWHRY